MSIRRTKTNQSCNNLWLRNRSKRGAVSLVEVALGSFLLFAVVFLSLDAYVYVQAMMINDQACRDAARSAASAIPTGGATSQTAYQAAAAAAANAQLKLHVSNNAWVKSPQLLACVWSDSGWSATSMPTPPAWNTPCPTPNVLVATSVQITLPAPLLLARGQSQTLTLKNYYVYPIVQMRPF